MARLPRPAADYVAAAIKGHITRLRVHAQQIASLQTGVSGLLPGTWENITLTGGWSNIPGYIPAQVRILQNGMSQVIGHIQGGSAGVVGSLDAGFFNSVHAHIFNANSISGASSVAHPGTGTVTDGTVLAATLPVTQIPTGNQTFNAFPVKFGPQTGGYQFQNIPPSSFTGATQLNSKALTSSTNVNKDTPVITLDISGTLTLTNVDPSVTQISFSELIPLLTA